MNDDVVAPSRFELESYDPESQMMDRYTKGLCVGLASSPSYFKPTDNDSAFYSSCSTSESCSVKSRV